ncbi:CRISPR-associated protein Cas2 [Alkalispirochaeta sphaeroplastigenens]|uniref:CRISPR-associated endoribonuclease Cas2 n=1 Tax=Alkalispirochaeta sphaeroplastigenens TaxID=1187066 RepID=A0A2S4JGN1_9SPIO|nr:CRISPR-associated endonuclease Cas2 [Alkalispirochaeta sphaeroplastigenens]POQ98708.1 CRISPR-associated protein Cas2 [Alkalispirochaeta sphaeroplastigenens]
MMVLVSYDVAVTSPGGATRLRKIAKECQNYGQRVQYSVFECVVDPAQWTRLKNKLEKIIDREQDSLRYYHLGSNYKRKIEHIGAKPSLDMEGPMIV